MAISLFDGYGARATNKSSDYPGGAFKNESAEGMNDGTPLEKEWANDKEGYFQGLLDRAGIVANNDTDTAPASQYLNALDALKASGTAPPQSTPAEMCSGLLGAPDIAWCDPSIAPNFADAATDVVDACVSLDPDTGIPVLFLVTDANTVLPVNPGPWKYDAAPTIGGALTLNLSPAADALLSICSDGSYVYLMYGAADGHAYIAKFSTENVFTSPPEDTIDVLSNYSAGGAYKHRYRLIVANSGYLGFIAPVSTTPVAITGVVDKGFNAVSIETHSSYYLENKAIGIVSDGTYLYAIAFESGTTPRDYRLIKSPISDLSSTVFRDILSADSLDWYEHPTGLYAVGENVVISRPQGEIYLYNLTYDNVSYIGTLPITPFTDDPYDHYGVVIGFDGINLWFHGLDTGVQPPTISNAVHSIYPISAGFFNRLSRQWGNPNTITSVPVRVDSREVTEYRPVGKILFDRKDVWFILRDGTIYRIANPGLR